MLWKQGYISLCIVSCRQLSADVTQICSRLLLDGENNNSFVSLMNLLTRIVNVLLAAVHAGAGSQELT